MGAASMLLLLVGCLVVAQVLRFFLTWKPKGKVGVGRGRSSKPVARRR